MSIMLLPKQVDFVCMGFIEKQMGRIDVLGGDEGVRSWLEIITDVYAQFLFPNVRLSNWGCSLCF